MYRIYMNESHEWVNTDPIQRSAAGQKIEINFHEDHTPFFHRI